MKSSVFEDLAQKVLCNNTLISFADVVPATTVNVPSLA
jgi:hypothetical protein